MSQIHETAIIEKGAEIGKNVTIEPYVIIKKNVVIGNNVTIKASSYIDGYTTIDEGTVIWPSASIGTQTQDKKFKGEKTYVRIGKNCNIREFVTINSSCGESSAVTIGDNCLIMACCHVAHNCTIGKGVIMANSALLAGHVTVEDCAILGGMVAIHQHCRIGRYAMVGGFSGLGHDLPPYFIGGRTPFKVSGLNLVGLKRHGLSFERRQILTMAFKIIYRSNLTLEEALAKIETGLEQTEEIQHLLKFCKNSKRGLAGHQSLIQEELDPMQEVEEILSQKVQSI